MKYIYNLSLNINNLEKIRPYHFKESKTLDEVKFIIDRIITTIREPDVIKKFSLSFYEEPILYHNIIEILDYIISKRIKYSSIYETNGIGLLFSNEMREIIKKFKEAGVTQIKINLDREIWRHISDNSEKKFLSELMNAIENIMDENLECSLNFFFPNENAIGVPKLIQKYEGLCKMNIIEEEVINEQKNWQEKINKSEKEIFKLLVNMREVEKRKGKIFLYEFSRKLYDSSNYFHPLFEVGHVYFFDWNKIFKERICSIGLYLVKKFLINDLNQIVKRLLNTISGKEYAFNSHLTELILKEIQNNLKFWIPKINPKLFYIYPQQSLSYRYFNAINQIYLENGKEEILIEDPWGWVTDELLSGYSARSVIMKLSKEFKEVPEIKISSDLKNLILSLYNLGFIGINIANCY